MDKQLIKDLIIQKVKREFTGEVTLESVVSFMCDNLPISNQVRDDIIRTEFDRRYKELANKNNKAPSTIAMIDLSIAFDCSERNIKRIIYGY